MDRKESTDLILECMQKEIHLMRELLSNMHQEEISLTMLDRSSWNVTMQERFPLIQSLSRLREKRDFITSKVGDGKIIPSEKNFPSNEEERCEILYLSDQIIALIEKMNLQQSKNINLFSRYENFYLTPSSFSARPLDAKTPFVPIKYKAAIATIPRNP